MCITYCDQHVHHMFALCDAHTFMFVMHIVKTLGGATEPAHHTELDEAE